MSLLVLIRHGESQWNLENRFTGWVDVPLTDKGRAEAHRAGERIRQIRFDQGYCSVLQRAKETLAIVLEETGQRDLPVLYDQALNERHYGDLQGLNKAETAKKFGDAQVHLWRRSYDIAPPGGESLKDTAARTLPYFEAHVLPDLRAGKNVLIVAHGNSLRSIVMSLDKLSREQVLELNLATGVPIVYDVTPDLQIRSKQTLAD